jgi:hypothetical protein
MIASATTVSRNVLGGRRVLLGELGRRIAASIAFDVNLQTGAHLWTYCPRWRQFPMDATLTTRALRFLTNAEAAIFLKLSPRTLDKFRVLGGGPKFRKFGRRVIYALDDLEAWANSRICESTSDENYFLAR